MSVRLIGRTGPTAGQDYLLRGVAIIGAAPDSQIRIVAPGVSRQHARIVVENGQYFVEDAGATNGTFLNGGRVSREPLRHLDVITLGRDVDLIFLERETGHTDVPVDQITAARVQITDGPDAGTVVDVPKGEMTFGRAPSCNVVVASGLVSKVHARLQRTANQVVLQDLQSINGTFVNGARVDAVVVLRNGDVINFAGVRTASIAIEGPGGAPRSAVATGAIPEGPAFNQEWKTRFMWAPEELAAIEAARAEAMQLVALRNAPAAEKKAAPAPLPRRTDAAKAEAAKAEGAAAVAKPPVAAPPKPAAAAPAAPPAKPAAAIPPKSPAAAKADAPKPAVTAPPPPVRVAEVPVAPVTPPAPPAAAARAQASVAPPAGPAQAAMQRAEAPVKPGSPIPVTKDPASAAMPQAAQPATPAEAAAKAAPPFAAKPAPPPPVAAKVETPKPPAAPDSPEPATIAMMPDIDQTLVEAKAPRVRGLKLVGAGAPIAVGVGAFVVGRAIGSDVRLDDRQVSRSHARITVDEASASIEDLQTVNGTLLNGKEVKARQPLRHGDTVQFGASEFKVELITT